MRSRKRSMSLNSNRIFLMALNQGLRLKHFPLVFIARLHSYMHKRIYIAIFVWISVFVDCCDALFRRWVLYNLYSFLTANCSCHETSGGVKVFSTILFVIIANFMSHLWLTPQAPPFIVSFIELCVSTLLIQQSFWWKSYLFSLLESIVICKISSTSHCAFNSLSRNENCLTWKFFFYPGPPSCHEGSWHLPQRARGDYCVKSYLMIATANLWCTNIFSISFLAVIYRLIHLFSSELFYLR